MKASTFTVKSLPSERKFAKVIALDSAIGLLRLIEPEQAIVIPFTRQVKKVAG